MLNPSKGKFAAPSSYSMTIKHVFKTACIALLSVIVMSGCRTQAKRTPVMGWSSWNNFRVNIDEKMIKEQADAMVTSGLYDAGYRYINIDDGYFGGRDSNGKLLVNTDKFPSGMRSLTDYVHSKKLKAGIYSDAGNNTCGSMYDKDKNGVGSGMYGHIQQDCDLFFKDWKFDFLKVDWCGGENMGLNEEKAYMPIINTVKAIDSNIVFNICRWQFPGAWAVAKADSWRVSGDISNKFSSILKIIDLDADLYKYASPGHYNDMDMLQVGRGMSYDEDKSHFSMWCMLNSPLLAGNDLRSMSKQTIEILTNKEVIALNQDPGYKQGMRVIQQGDVDVWVKPLGTDDRSEAVAILNRGNAELTFDLSAQQLKIGAKSTIRDLWLQQDLGPIGNTHKFAIPKHGIVVLKVKKK